MRQLVLLAAAALLLSGVSAYAQQKDSPTSAQGAGSACSRMTDAKQRDECVRQAQQKENAAKAPQKKGADSKNDASKGKKP